MSESWQQALKDAIRDPHELCRLLRLPAEFEAAALRSSRLFPLFVPRAFAARMRPGDPRDPLLRQVLPLAEEEAEVPGYTADPLAEATVLRAPGLLEKYAGRALMVATGACAVHCRYCFRRHFPYQELPHGLAAWQPAIDRIQADATIHEVILSGGDPLTLTDEVLASLARRLAEIPHLSRIRVHTRLPIVISQRVCDRMLEWLCGTRLKPIVVVHANHSAEIDGDVANALSRLLHCGVPVLNQTVLLRGVNDDVQTLTLLSERLIDLGVMPYYLHQLDRVAGAAHFDVPESAGREIIRQMRTQLPGYAVPRYVREIPTEPNKVVLA